MAVGLVAEEIRLESGTLSGPTAWLLALLMVVLVAGLGVLTVAPLQQRVLHTEREQQRGLQEQLRLFAEPPCGVGSVVID